MYATWIAVCAWLVIGVVGAFATPKLHKLGPASDLANANLHVTVGHRGKELPCSTTKAGTHRCADDVWHFVGSYADRADGQPFSCLWVHPPKKGKTLTLTWDQVPLAAEVSVVLALLPGSNDGASVRAGVAVDGRARGATSTSHERVVARLSTHVSTVADDPEKLRTLTVSIDAENNRWRLACLQLRARSKR